MSALRDEIRAILREEIAALRREALSRKVETVRIETGQDLMSFAIGLLDRSADPAFATDLRSGALEFRLERELVLAPAVSAIPTGQAAIPVAAMGSVTKALITEKDITALDAGCTVLRLAHNNRLTPLAADEARRRGIRIERRQR